MPRSWCAKPVFVQQEEANLTGRYSFQLTFRARCRWGVTSWLDLRRRHVHVSSHSTRTTHHHPMEGRGWDRPWDPWGDSRSRALSSVKKKPAYHRIHGILVCLSTFTPTKTRRPKCRIQDALVPWMLWVSLVKYEGFLHGNLRPHPGPHNATTFLPGMEIAGLMIAIVDAHDPRS